jgi:hypothetical protein
MTFEHAERFTIDGHRAVSTSRDQTLRLWDLENLEKRQSAPHVRHRGPVTAIGLGDGGMGLQLPCLVLAGGAHAEDLNRGRGHVDAMSVVGKRDRAGFSRQVPILVSGQRVVERAADKDAVLRPCLLHGVLHERTVLGLIAVLDGKRVRGSASTYYRNRRSRLLRELSDGLLRFGSEMLTS